MNASRVRAGTDDVASAACGDSGEARADESGIYTCLGGRVPRARAPEILRKSLNELAMDGGARWSADAPTGLPWAGMGAEDALNQWQHDEWLSQCRSERRQIVRQRVHLLAMGFGGLGTVVALLTMDAGGLPGGEGLEALQQALRGQAGTIAAWRSGPATALAQQPFAVRAADFETAEITVVVSMPGTAPVPAKSAVAAPPPEESAAVARKIVTSARAARELESALLPWSTAPVFQATAPADFRLISNEAAQGGGNPAPGEPLRRYCAPADVAVMALRQALQRDYPDAAPLDDLVPAAGTMVELQVRTNSGPDHRAAAPDTRTPAQP